MKVILHKKCLFYLEIKATALGEAEDLWSVLFCEQEQSVSPGDGRRSNWPGVGEDRQMVTKLLWISSNVTRYQEYVQTDFGVERVRHWANMTGRLTEDDIFISGDVDEILYPSTLNLLRWCEVSVCKDHARQWRSVSCQALSYLPGSGCRWET